MFFRKDYATPGPGLDPNAPEKTGPARMFQILQLECVTLFKLNLLFLITCLPVVTIPPAIYAMHMVVRRMVLDEPVECLYHYRTAFRQHWKRGYAAFLLVALPLFVSGWGVGFYLNYAAENPLFFLPFVLCATVFLVTLFTSPYLYGVLSTGKPIRASLRLAVALGLGKPLRSLLAILSVYGLMIVSILEFPLSAGYLLLIGFSVPCLLANFFIRTVLKKYVAPTPEAEPTS
jgi:hypothetical protein